MAFPLTGLTKLSDCREELKCLRYSLRAVEHPQNSRMFPYNEDGENVNLRKKELFKVNSART